MKYWLVLYHHRHGINHLVLSSDTEPDPLRVRDYLIAAHGAEFDRDDEGWEMEETSIDPVSILDKRLATSAGKEEA